MIVGPLASLVIGFAFLLIARLSGWSPRYGAAALPSWLAALARLHQCHARRFNMIPDIRSMAAASCGRSPGGSLTMPIARHALRPVGQTVAFLFIMLGLYRFFAGANFGGLWLAFIGWFLLDASRRSYVQVELTSGLRGRPVADIMDRDCPTVEGHLSLQDFVHEYLLRSGRRCFAVVHNGELTGPHHPT